jgi:type IV pilus assembly protein PilV
MPKNSMPHPLPNQTRRQAQYGFSLVEVLISIVVLSFGMLAMVGLQASALQANREARMQSTATNLARELAEKMRGNHDIAILTANNPYLGNFAYPMSATTPTYCYGVGQNCDVPGGTEIAKATQVANAEMTEWLARVDDILPEGRVRVCFDSAPFDASGNPQWDCTNSGDIAVVKIGWTRGSTNRTPTATALEKATIPSVVFPVTPASTL